MNRLPLTIYSLLLLIGLSSGLMSQSISRITLDDIYHEEKFTSNVLDGLRSMNDGLHYTIQDQNRINKYSYRTGEISETLFDASDFHEIGQFNGYSLNASEDKILIETDNVQIYRHSYLADYYIYDRGTGELAPLSSNGKQQLGTFSPSGDRIAFVRNNNLFIRDLLKDMEMQVTFDGVRNKIINGTPDWVYEEEFGFSQGFYWSPDGNKIAF